MDMNKKEMTLAIPGLVQCEYGRLSGEDCDYKVTIERRKVTSASFLLMAQICDLIQKNE